MKTHNGSPTSPTPPSPKPRHHRNNRELTSRFLPSPSTSTESSECHSPIQRKPSSPVDDDNNNNHRRHKITEEPVFMRHQLWPSSAKNNSGTLADHISQDRIIEQKDKDKDKDKPTNKKTSSLVSHKSYREFTTFDNYETPSNISREIGGSARHTARFSSSSSSSSLKKLSSNSSVIVPGRFSLDENAKPLSLRRSSNVTSSLDLESQYGDGDASLVSPPARKAGLEVPSRFMNDATLRRARRGASDSNVGNLNGDLLKPTLKRVNSVTGHKSSKSQWALSPGRSEFSSPTKVKGVEKLLTFGFDLFKSKKPPVLSSPPVGVGNFEGVHTLRLLHNRFNQWRYVNARAQVVNAKIACQTKSNLICAWDGLTKLRCSVMKKKIQFAREKLEMKIAFVLYYQLKLLESWGAMERQHVSAITATKECLHSVVCKVPLMEGAKVNIPLTSIALRHAFDVTASIKSILTCFSPAQIDKTVVMLSELAKVVAQEKRLIEEFYDLFQTISVFELQERSAKCDLVQLEGWQRKYQLQKILPKITS